jgi:CRP/FNR family transcriptional regulator
MNTSHAILTSTNKNEILKIAKSFKKDQNVYQQGDKAIKYYKVKSGIIAIGNYTEEGKMVFKCIVQEGEYFGDEVVSGLEERMNFALVFSKDVEIEEYRYTDFWENLEHQKEVLQSNLKRNLSIQKTMEVNSSLTVEERVIRFFKELASKKAIKLLTGDLMIRMHVKHKELAFICNSSRQCVSSIVSHLQKDGLIKMDRSSIILTPEL